MKRILNMFLCILLLGTGVFSLSAGDNYNTAQKNFTSYEVTDSIVQQSLDDLDVRLEDYIDIDYFSNLEISSNKSSDINKLFVSTEKEDTIIIDDEQYTALIESITNIFNDLNEEEYEIFKELAQDDSNIYDMIDMIENGFELDSNSLSPSNNIIKMSAGVTSIASILTAQGVSSAAIIAIKGAFNSMIATLKAFFAPNSVKGAIVTASILVISSVVIINWNKIKPVFNNIVNIFASNAKKLANTVTKVFNNIFQMAIKATTYNNFDDVVNKDNEINQRLKNSGRSLSKLKEVLQIFLGVASLTSFYNSNNKVLCIGRDIKETYDEDDIRGYQNYAKQNNYWSFWVRNYNHYLLENSEIFLELCNDVLIYYCCANDWDFILVTNPYYYMAEHLDTRYGGIAYANEIAIIRNNGYNYFTNVSLSWNTIPYPGMREENYYSYAGYRVSK